MRSVEQAAEELERGRVEREKLHELSAQAFSRGAATGFLTGVDHQALVDGRTCDHVGIEVGRCLGVNIESGRPGLYLHTEQRLARGDGILVQGKRGSDGELGGRIWQMRYRGRDVESCERADDLWVWLGPERRVVGDYAGRRVFRTSASAAPAELAAVIPKEPERVVIAARLVGDLGQPPRLSFETADERSVDVVLDQPLVLAHSRALDAAAIREKLERLGDTSYRLERLDVELPEGTTLPLSALNRARRVATTTLRRAAHRPHVVQVDSAVEQELVWPDKTPAPRGLFVTCRTREQAEAALTAGAQGIYLDFLALTGMGAFLRELRAHHVKGLGVALPRIRKPGEEKIDEYVRSLEPELVLVRSLGSLASIAETSRPDFDGAAPHQPTWVGDFSLNATNSVTAAQLLARPLSAFTPGYDLDAAQLLALLDSPLAGYAEVVVHHPMPLFHMEHCVLAALLSDGKDYRDCGRPCERHVVALRDRTGMELPLEADVGCRNTVFHGIAQSGADIVARLLGQGVGRFRIELVRENGQQTEAVVRAYAELVAGHLTPNALRQRLAALGLRVVRGTLRVVG
jgi:U32 family peptidase